MNIFKLFFHSYKSFITIVIDLLIIIVSIFSAFLFRFNFNINFDNLNLFIHSALPIVFLQGFVFFVLGVHKSSWRFVGIKDLLLITLASFIIFIIIACLDFFLGSYILLSVYILQLILLIFLCSSLRVVVRLYYEGYSFKSNKPPERVVIIGTDIASIDIAKVLLKNSQFKLVGFIDNKSLSLGRLIHGFKVLGPLSALNDIKKRHSLSSILIPSSYKDYLTRSRILAISKSLDLKLLWIPSIDDLAKGKFKFSHFENFSVDDLLGRDPVHLDITDIGKLLSDQSILISGAGGSIGSQIFIDVLTFSPRHIICLDNSELALYNLEKLKKTIPASTKIHYIVADIKDSSRINSILKRFAPSMVFHAAAYKHLPLMENNNVCEALSNNAYGTYLFGNACIRNKVKKFILISTDKAINPTNVMGASKRLAEIFCQIFDHKSKTDFITVRFGNVLGSSGSVIPLFKKQIESGGPLTITHKDITRYFMSIPEASQLVLQASFMGRGGEIFILDMGKPIKILNLAKDMIKLASLSTKDIKI